MDTTRAKQERIEYSPYQMRIAGKHMLAILKGLEPKYTPTDVNRSIVGDLIRWVHADGGGALNKDKAIGLIGPTGTGKTLTIEAVNQYMNIDDVQFIYNGRVIPFRYRIATALGLHLVYESKGSDGIMPFINRRVLCIDELATEPTVSKYYGNEVSLIETLIQERYMRGNITHFTSNKNEAQLLERYGDRIMGRIIERTNIIPMEDVDWRLVGG